jgi:transposase
MGGFLTTIGKDAEALAAYRLARTDQETLAAAAGASSEIRRDLGDTVNRIGRVLANTGKPREAEAEYRKALAIRQKLADDYPANADFGNALSASYNNLGLVLASTGRPREAEAEQCKAMAIRQELVDRNPAVSQFRDHLAASHFNLGILMVNMGRTAEAEAAFIDDPDGFRDAKAVGRYFGLVPSQDQSGDRNRLGHITHEGPAVVRQLVAEATWQALRRSPTVRAYFERVGRGDLQRKKIAVVATAHYLVRVMWALLKRGTSWEEGVAAADEPKGVTPSFAAIYRCSSKNVLLYAGSNGPRVHRASEPEGGDDPPVPDEVGGSLGRVCWRDILWGFRRRRAGEQGRSSPPPAPPASLSLSRPKNCS